MISAEFLVKFNQKILLLNAFKTLMTALFENLPQYVIKIRSVMLSGQTIGWITAVSMGKSYILSCHGIGVTIPLVFDYFSKDTKVTAIEYEKSRNK